MSRILVFFSFLLLVISQNSQAQSENAVDPMSICYSFTVSPTPKPSQVPKCRVIGNTMYWEGEISNHLTYELFQIYPNVTRLELNSYGGVLEEALGAAEKIRAKGITTNVRKDAFCASACTLVYQAGLERTAHITARFLYHSANYSGEGWYAKWKKIATKNGRESGRAFLAELIEKSQTATEELFKVYRRYGINELFFSDYQKRPESPDWFEIGNFSRLPDWLPSMDQLVSYGIVQKVDASP